MATGSGNGRQEEFRKILADARNCTPEAKDDTCAGTDFCLNPTRNSDPLSSGEVAYYLAVTSKAGVCPFSLV